jgi:hypothetical protein
VVGAGWCDQRKGAAELAERRVTMQGPVKLLFAYISRGEDSS